MKKLVFLLMLCILTSCSRDVILESTPEQNESTFVTEEMAISAVKEFLSSCGGTYTKSGERTISDIYSTIDLDLTRADSNIDEVEEPFVYVVNFDGNNGYALVSGDTRMPLILAVVDTGNLPQGGIIENPGAIAMLGNIDVEYRMTIGLPVENPNGGLDYPIGVNSDGTFIYPAGLDTVSNEPVNPYEPLVITYEYTEWENYELKGNPIACEWEQNVEPYNSYTFTEDGSRAPAGCVAVAVAQIMYYWGKDCTIGGYSFDWDLMRRHKSIKENYPEAYDMIGMLFLKLGIPENLDIEYRLAGSGSNNSNVPRTFVNFGYSSGGEFENYDYGSLCEKISEGPVYISGYSHKTEKKFLGITVKTTYSGGHAWVIDQTMKKRRYKTTYINGEKNKTEMQYQNFVYCNFGWGCADESEKGYNGYYHSVDFNTNIGSGNPVETRPSGETTRGEDYYYQYKLEMNTSIRP